jgi:ribose 5-phosphate isomerase B
MSYNHSQKIIHVASDHAGFPHKVEIVRWLIELGHEVVDHGAKVLDSEDDYPDFIALAAAAVSASPESSCGIIFGGSGQGEAMLANRYANVRATVYYGNRPEIISLSREHNDANVLSVGARFVSIEETKDCISTWLAAEMLADEKYLRRNQKLEHITRRIRTS